MESNPQPTLIRDGTSQSGRILQALDPDRAPVDDRTIADRLAFVRALAAEVAYFDESDPDVVAGSWSGLLPASSADLGVGAAYADGRVGAPADRAAVWSRPHVALLLTFLKLLDSVQPRINAFTRRHLEFYFHDVLHMVRKGERPDHVNVVVELANRTSELLLPAGTALRAGKDSRGQDLVYRTDSDLVASRVQVGQISSVRADIRTIGIDDARRQYLATGTRNDAFVEMLRIALGQPDPGDPLPIPVYPGVPPALDPKSVPQVTFDVLLQVQRLLAVVEVELGMPDFDDFRSLMRLRQSRRDNDTANWAQINAYLKTAGTTRDPKFQFTPTDPAAFQTNLQTVLNKTPTDFAQLFYGLPEVRSLEDAFALYPKRDDVRRFIQPPVDNTPGNHLYLSLDDFRAMMQIKMLMDNEWSEIDRLLQAGGRRKRNDPSFTLPPAVVAARRFDDTLTAAVGSPNYTVAGGLDGYLAALLAVEQYFHLPAEGVRYIMSVATRAPSAGDEWDWQQVDDMLAEAHREMIYARRRQALKDVAKDDMALALTAVLGESLPVNDALKRLGALGVRTEDVSYLSSIANGATADWSRVYTILEVAQRNREGFTDPVAEKVEWRNLYPARDATQVLALSAQSDADAVPRWKTFGQVIDTQAAGVGPTPAPNFGWALSSPLLALAEGKRTIVLTLGFSPDPVAFDPAKIRALLDPADDAPAIARFNPFQVQVSTAGGWLELASATLTWTDPNFGGYPVVKDADTSALRVLVVTATLEDDQPATVPLTRAIHGIDTASPMLRLMMKPVWDAASKSYVTSYQMLRDLALVRAHVSASASGLTSLVLGNDQGMLDAKRPFEPFGHDAPAGARFFVGHPEIVGKQLESLTFHAEWMGAPKDFAAYYAGYPDSSLANGSFKADVSLIDGRASIDLGQVLLFNTSDASAAATLALASLPADQGTPRAPLTPAADVTSWDRSLVWELNAPDFQFAVYPSVALAKSLKMAKTPSQNAADYLVNVPYTPKIKRLSVDYTASAELTPGAAFSPTNAARVFHVHPFGFREPTPDGAMKGTSFLPQFDYEGELYIGLQNVAAPQTVSLLFQMAEGSANPDVAPAPLEWSVLSGDRWITLQDGGLLSDGTRGFINSGIVTLSLKAVAPSGVLPQGLYWIRVAIPRASDGVSDTIAILPNAVAATFDDRDNAPDHLATPLPSGSITGSVTPIPGVAAVRQPYTSFGGKLAERDDSFHVRVSERLRHKERAVTPWDYERLVLEHFPQIYKVKCLRTDGLVYPSDPGRIDVVVVPDIRNRFPFNPFEPKAQADLIRDIATFLADKTPAFANVQVRNARFIPVRVRCGVRFMPGADEGFCIRRLNDDINRFLSPWAYADGADLVIGGSVYANSLVDFVDRRDYVDYVAELKLFRSLDNGVTFTLVKESDGNRVTTDWPDGVLVAAREHDIDVISQADYRVEGFAGIDFMKIELDFVVG